MEVGDRCEYVDWTGEVVPCRIIRVDKDGTVHVRMRSLDGPKVFFSPWEINQLRLRSLEVK